MNYLILGLGTGIGSYALERFVNPAQSPKTAALVSVLNAAAVVIISPWFLPGISSPPLGPVVPLSGSVHADMAEVCNSYLNGNYDNAGFMPDGLKCCEDRICEEAFEFCMTGANACCELVLRGYELMPELPHISKYEEMPEALKCCKTGIDACCDFVISVSQCFLNAPIDSFCSAIRAETCTLSAFTDFIPAGMANAWNGLSACFTGGDLDGYLLHNRIFECFSSNHNIATGAMDIKGALTCVNAIT